MRAPGGRALVALAVLALWAQAVWASTVVVGIDSDMVSADPARATRHTATGLVHSLLYEPMIRTEWWGYASAIAEGIRPLSPTEWELTIDPRIGLDAQEIAVGLRRLLLPGEMGGATSPAQDRIPAVSDVYAVGTEKLVVVLHERLPAFPTLLSHEFVAVPEGERLIGTGAYRLEEWQHGNRITLMLAEGVTEESTGLPERVVFEVIPSSTRRVEAFLNGQLDLLPMTSWDMVPQDLPLGVQVRRRPGTRSRFIELNTNRPPFDDRRVRLALNLALDIPRMLEEVYRGWGYPLATIVTPKTVGYAGELQPIPYVPERAKVLLSEAGYANGFHFELDVIPNRLDEALFYARMWEEIGVHAHIRLWPDWSTLKSALLDGERLAWTAEWNNTSQDPGSVLGAKLGTSGVANYGRYSDPEVDRLLLEAEDALTIAERLDRYRDVQAHILADAVMIFGYAEEELTLVRDGVSLPL